MATQGRSTVVGVFRTREQARDAIDALKNAGFSSQDIGILMQDKGDTQEMARDTGTSAGTGAATGAVGGGILGGLAGWLVGVGALAIPGVGPFIAAGALGTALAGAAIGAGIGAVAGALIGMGVPEEEAKWYEGEVHGGGTLVTVRSDTRHDEARRILKDHGAYDIRDRDAGTITTGMGTRGMGTADMDTTAAYDTTRSELTGTGRWDDVSSDYRTHWQQRHGSMGGRWEEFEPSYRYGYEMSRDPRYRGRSFSEVEPELRRDWETRHRDKPWDRFVDAIRDAWEGATRRDRAAVSTT